MIRFDINQCEFDDFILPFGGRLDANNRWVKLATLVPWERVHVLYDEGLSRFEGAPSLSHRFRCAFYQGLSWGDRS